jgi:hypothetical protein
MNQVTVRLSPVLSRALQIASRRLQRKNSEIVRMALREFLNVGSGTGGRAVDRVRGLIGSLESGRPGSADKHRAYILESLKHGR